VPIPPAPIPPAPIPPAPNQSTSAPSNSIPKLLSLRKPSPPKDTNSDSECESFSDITEDEEVDIITNLKDMEIDRDMEIDQQQTK